MKIGSPGFSQLRAAYSSLDSKSPELVAGLKSSAAFTSKIEKHLDDVQKGKGYLSQETHKQLVGKNRRNSEFLGQTDPSALRLYSGIVSGLNYQLSTRLVNGVEQGARTVERLDELNSLDQKNMTNQLIDRFSGLSSYSQVIETPHEDKLATDVKA